MNTLIVQKFGGTSLKSIERISYVAKLIASEFYKGKQIVVVVSSMGKETDRLLNLANNLCYKPNLAEVDVLLSSGEQASCALLVIALNKLKIQARSCLGWQVPIITDNVHSNARIIYIETSNLYKILSERKVVVIPGFQGVSKNFSRVTTLGRGGSDVTAVAIASALKASRCDIYTDVDGIYTADPKVVCQAQKLDSISYEVMLELASLGASVLHPRAVELAAKNCLSLRVLSSFKKIKNNSGTLINESSTQFLESGLVQGIALQDSQAFVSLKGSIALEGVFCLLTKARLKPDTIQQQSGQVLLIFEKIDADKAYRLLATLQVSCKFQVKIKRGLSKVSIVGLGLQQDMNVLNILLRILAEHQVKVQAVISSETKVSVLVEEVYGELVIQLLHQAYGLKIVKKI